MTVAAALVVAALAYGGTFRAVRLRSGHGSSLELAAFMAGLAIIGIALISPIGALSDRLLSVHMVEHLLLTMVAPPLLLLGGPVSLVLRAASPRARKRVLIPLLRTGTVRFLSNPLLGWGLFGIALWGSHFSGLYELTLENGAVHQLEHAMYLGTALLFWRPVVARDPSPVRLSQPGRLFYMFVSMPVTTFLGLAIYSSDRVLYPHYAAATARLGLLAVADQHLAGAIMWVSSMVILLPALGFVLFDWLDREDREAVRANDRGPERAGVGSRAAPDSGAGPRAARAAP